MVYGSVIRLPRQPTKLLCMPMYVHFIFSGSVSARKASFPTARNVSSVNAPRNLEKGSILIGCRPRRGAGRFTLPTRCRKDCERKWRNAFEDK